MKTASKRTVYSFVAITLFVVALFSAWWTHREFPGLLNLIGQDSRRFLTTTLFFVAGQPVRVLFLIKTVLFLLFLNLLSRIARVLLRRVLVRNPEFGPHQQYVLSRAVSFLIYATGLLIGIQIERINLSTLAIVGGTLGVAIGFGLQSVVSNFVAGLILLIEQPIKLGDRVEFGEKTGEVIRVGSRSSWIRTYDNATLIVPNAELVNKLILNWTTLNLKKRLTITVSVAYGSDVERVMDLLRTIAATHQLIADDPVPGVVLAEIGQSAIVLSLRVWTQANAEQFTQIRSDLYVQILKQFRDNNIEMPFSQMDLHLKPAEVRNVQSRGHQD